MKAALWGAIFAMAFGWTAGIAGEPAGYPLITAYSADDIGADPTGWNTVQDKKGVLYFATPALISFDGDRWGRFPITEGTTIRGLAWENDDRLWIGAVGDLGWFDRTANGWAYHSLVKSVPAPHKNFGNIWQTFRDERTTTFVADERILRWDGKEMEAWPFPTETTLWGVKSGDDVFVHHQETGVYQMTASGPVLAIPASVLGSEFVRIMLMEKVADGEWLAVTTKGVGRISRTEMKLVAGTADNFLGSTRAWHAIALPDGRIAVASRNGGVAFIRRDGSLDRIISVAEGMPTPRIGGLFVARDGELWVTTFSHIVRISLDPTLAMFDARADLPAPKLFHRVITHEGNIYVGTHDSVHRLDSEQNKFTELPDLRGRVSELRSTPHGLWVSSSPVVRQLANDQVSIIHTFTKDAFATLPLPSGGFLVAESQDVTKVEGGAVVRMASSPDLILSLARDRGGRIWMGTQNRGVFVAEAGAGPKPVDARWPEDELKIATMKGKGVVRMGRQGEVIALSSNGGWVVREAGAVAEKIAGLPLRPLLFASETLENGDIWLLFDKIDQERALVGRVSIQAGQATWAAHTVNGFEKIGLAQAIGVEQAGSNAINLWLGGSQSVLRSKITDGPSAPVPQAPTLTALTRKAGSAEWQRVAAGNELPYATETVAFELASPEYVRRPMLRIETRIDGIDPDWIPAGKDARRALSGLRDGAYTLRSRAVAETGRTSPETHLTFTVLPPWWRTKGAYAGAASAVLILGVTIYQLRVRALRRRNADLEQKVRERTEELVAASAAKTEFVANMSHDIRNPLNGILGMALALEDTKLDSKQTELVSTLRECTTYLSSLVDDVLDFASIEAGKVELRPGSFAPAELLRSIVTTLKGDTAEGGARLTVDVGPEVPERLMGDAGRIQQILVNYVSNALKYAGGHIRLSAALRPNAPGEVEFSVRDSGPGIGSAEQATLFTKFTRLKGAREGDIPGTGLGLAACRLLADIMGGSVGLVSKPGEGARFFLRLPVTVATKTAEAPLAAIPNTTVLLVEDTDYNAWAAQAVLSRLGLTCERARTGAEAIQLFQAKRFNLVLLDRNLPDMDGLEVARQMRAGESGDLQAVLLAVTAYCTAEDRKLCLDAGMDAFVGKPLTPEKLRRVLLAMSRKLVGTGSVDVPADLPATEPDLSMLSFLADDAEDVDAQIERFGETLGETEQALDQAAASRDFAALAKAAHLLISQARMVNGGALAEAARRLETAAQAHEEAPVADLRRRVAREGAALMAALRLRRSSVPSA